jgi:nitrogenase iron protein NifH
MLKIAFYGKGGIGKSTVTSNLAAAFTGMGLRVMQIGCDPKADSTILHRSGNKIPTVLDLIRERNDDFTLDEMVYSGAGGVLCVEAGGPVPGLGCAGRGIIAALEKLEQKGAYEVFRPDIVLYDVLGDVVCGGFTMPMRKGYADRVCIVTSGEKMSVYAAANIAMALENFRGRGYASLSGLILNRRNVEEEEKRVQELAETFRTQIIGDIALSQEVRMSETLGRTAVSAFPESETAKQFSALAESLWKNQGEPC